MGEKGNVAAAVSAAPDLVDRGVGVVGEGADLAKGVVVGGVTSAASSAVEDRVQGVIHRRDKKDEPDDKNGSGGQDPDAS